MPEYRRWRQSGETYFFTLVTDRRRPIWWPGPCWARLFPVHWALTHLPLKIYLDEPAGQDQVDLQQKVE
jgi:hypothetical protein